MATDIIIHDKKDNVGVVVVEKITPKQDCACWIMEDDSSKNIESLDNLEKNSMDFYASVRSLYLQDRQMKVSNSKAIIETMDDSDWEEIETQ